MTIRIRTLSLPDGAMLAPMAGATDLPFRILCREMGSAFAVSEMISAKGYLCAPHARAVQSLLERAPQEGPVALQLFGHEPDVMAEAARRAACLGFAAIDLNMGCPAPKVTGNGDGSALLRDPNLAARVIAAVRAAVQLPVLVKMRIGWDDKSVVAVPFARMAESEGADALTVHGRTRAQQYGGEADWDEIARVAAAVRVPVIGNGDIASGETARKRLRESGCAAVMIGRGALGNPWVFKETRAALRGEAYTPPTGADRFATAMRHARMLAAAKGEAVAVREMRRHAVWYTKGVYGAVRARDGIQSARSLAELSASLSFLLAENR